MYYVLRSGALPPCCQLKEHIQSPTVTTAIDIKNVGSRKLQAVRCYRSQKHLQPVDQAAQEALLNQPEHFHRRFPAWVETLVENDRLGRPVPTMARR